MQRKKTKKQTKQLNEKTKEMSHSILEFFDEMGEDFDPEEFLRNLKELKEDRSKKQSGVDEKKAKKRQKISIHETDDSRREAKKTRKQTANKDKTKSFKDMRTSFKAKDSFVPTKVIIQNRVADRLNQQIDNISSIIENKISKERGNSRTPSVITKKKIKEMNDRFNNFQTKKKDKIRAMQNRKSSVEDQELTFKPKINKYGNLYSRSFIDSNSKRLDKEEKLRLKQLAKKKKEDEELKKYCTFKPKINKSGRSPNRSVSDMYNWQKELDYKMMLRQEEKEIIHQRDHTFSPAINRNFRKQSRDSYKNVGERLYAMHKIKTKEKKQKMSVSKSKNQEREFYSNQKKSFKGFNSHYDEEDIIYGKSINCDNETRYKTNSRKNDSSKGNNYVFMNNSNYRPSHEIFNTRLENESDMYESYNTEMESERDFMKSSSKKQTSKVGNSTNDESGSRTSEGRFKSKPGRKKYYNVKKDKKLKISDLKNYQKDFKDLQDYVEH